MLRLLIADRPKNDCDAASGLFAKLALAIKDVPREFGPDGGIDRFAA